MHEKETAVLADGVPGESLTEETLSALYGIEVAVRETEVGGEAIKLSIPYQGGASK